MRETRILPLNRILPLLAILVAGLPASAQQPPATDVEAILRQAREEIRNFEKAGGRKDDPNHPVEKWVRTLWKAHDESPGTADAATAASEAVHLLIHADRFAEAYARVDRVGANDLAWRGLAQVLREAATMQKDFTRFFERLQPVASGAPDA